MSDISEEWELLFKFMDEMKELWKQTIRDKKRRE
jgi:hypothetical protein